MENLSFLASSAAEGSLHARLLALLSDRSYLLDAYLACKFELLHHASASVTCAEKSSLAGVEHHLVIKTVFFELMDKLYGVMSYGDLLVDTTTLFSEALGISRSQAKRARLARKLPSGMQAGTCTPFLSAANLNEVEHLYLACPDSADWVNVSLGGTDSESKSLSARVRYEELLALVQVGCGSRCSQIDLSRSPKTKSSTPPAVGSPRLVAVAAAPAARAAPLDGRALASRIRARVSRSASVFQQTFARRPALSVLMVGDDYASRMYLESEKRACADVGIECRSVQLPLGSSRDRILDHVEQLNEDRRVDGILVQLPLPPHVDPEHVRDAVDPDKDVDGFHPYNMGLLAQGRPRFRACTSRGVIRLLEAGGVALGGLHAVLVGASNLVGRPMLLELLMANCTVTVCHKDTVDLGEHVRGADLLVVAVGRPGLIPGDWIKPGAVVVDVGTSRGSDGRLVGDVDFEGAARRARLITPVPGGVGPMTVAQLLENTLQAALLRAHREEPRNSFEKAQLELCGSILAETDALRVAEAARAASGPSWAAQQLVGSTQVK